MTEQAIATWSSHTVQDTDPRLDQLPTTQALKRDIELHSHYRAKTFVCQPGHNPLLSAGAPLLTLLARLRQAKHYEQINELFRARANGAEGSRRPKRIRSSATHLLTT